MEIHSEHAVLLVQGCQRARHQFWEMLLADPVDQLARVDLLGALEVLHASLRGVVTVALDDRCELDFIGRGSPHDEVVLVFLALGTSIALAVLTGFSRGLHNYFLFLFYPK